MASLFTPLVADPRSTTTTTTATAPARLPQHSSSICAPIASDPRKPDRVTVDEKMAIIKLKKSGVSVEQIVHDFGGRVADYQVWRLVREFDRGKLPQEVGHPRLLNGHEQLRLLAELAERDRMKNAANSKDLQTMVWFAVRRLIDCLYA